MKRAVSIGTALALSAVLVFSLWHSDARGGEKAGGKDAPLKLGEERKLPDEELVFKQLVGIQLAIMKGTPGGAAKRGQHPRHYGCVDAEFIVLGELPENCRYGIFKQPKTYQAKIRFSNGAAPKDTIPDIHGMAIKVFGVKGPRALEKSTLEEQDFVLIDSPAFFAKDAKEVLGFLTGAALKEKKPEVLTAFAKSNPDFMARLEKSKKSIKDIPSPLAIPYWSTVPYKLGSGAVKYGVTPAEGNHVGKPLPDTDDNKLGKAMLAHLTTEKRSAEFAFYLVRQTDAKTMPIEDPTIAWNEDKKVRVATIKIKAQVYDTPERMKECEDLSYDPWNALADHRPLGNINRARKAVYEASSNLRHEKK